MTETVEKSSAVNISSSYPDKLSLNLLMQAIKFFESTELAVKRLEIKNSPQFHFRFDGCQNVHIDRLTINSPAKSPNTDGIHIENTNNVKIYNSVISTGNFMDPQNYVVFLLCVRANKFFSMLCVYRR